MTDEFKDRIFQGAQRMVIWGESEADILHRLEVNGIPADEARQMYKRALAESTFTTKIRAMKQILLGLTLLLTALFFFYWISQGAGELSHWTVSAILLPGLCGVWCFFKGLYGCIFSRSK